MPVVKLINNPNRSANPFKSNFLLAFKVPQLTSRDTTRGKIEGNGNYVFNHYQQLVEFEDYLIDYINDRVSQVAKDKSLVKWSLDEDMEKAYLYYLGFFREKEQDEELKNLWIDLKVNIQKVDAFIETNLQKVWEGYLEFIVRQGNPTSNSQEEVFKKAKIVLMSGAFDVANRLGKQAFFKESLKSLSGWIALICKAKGLQYEITQKVTSTGVKYDVFKEVSGAIPAVVIAENANTIKKKYVEYEKAQLKTKLSGIGAFTEVKLEDGDRLDLYLNDPKNMPTIAGVIKRRKLDFLQTMNLPVDLDIDTMSEVKEEDYLVKMDQLAKKKLSAKLLSTSVAGTTEDVIKKILSETDMDLTFANLMEYLIAKNNIVPIGLSLKPLITKFKQFKIDSNLKLSQICQNYFLSQGWDIDQYPYKEMFEKLVSLVDVPSFKYVLDEYNMEKEIIDSDMQINKRAVKQLYGQLKELEKPNSIVKGKTLKVAIKEEQKKFLDKAHTIYSEKLGVIESENGLSAYEVYQQKKFDVQIKSKVLRDAFPEIRTITVTNQNGEEVQQKQLVFKHIKRRVIYEKDELGNVIFKNGEPVPKYETKKDGTLKFDEIGNPIPLTEDLDMNIPPIVIDHLPDSVVDSLPGEEREVELSDDTTPKASNPLRFAHWVKVKTTTIKGVTKDIITRGPMKGFSVEDLANATGRLTSENKCYSVGANGKIINIYEGIKVESGDIKINYNVLEEPYITWFKGRFVIALPKGDAFKGERGALKNLKKTRASVEEIENISGTRVTYYFDGDDYESIKDSLGSCLMTRKAHEELEKYYGIVLQKDKALNAQNLEKYKPVSIGGFKDNIVFNNKQVEALAWLDANDLKGVMALDTGVGKTLVGVTAMQLGSKKEKDAKFLIVGPDALRGNFLSEVRKFLTEDVADGLAGNVEKKIDSRAKEIGYTEFVKMYESKFDFENEYYCMIFDEVNEALTGKKAQAISGVKHKRKILLTASALETSPMDLFRFVSLSTGNPIEPAKEKAFADKYAINIGGKFVGIKPEARHQFNIWLKQNAYFADKMDVDYEAVGKKQLKPLVKLNTAVNMPPEVGKAYVEVASGIKNQLKEMKDRYSALLTQNAEDISVTLQKEKDIAVGNLKDKIALLHLFSLNPHKAMAKYNKMKGIEPKTYTFVNPKVEQATALATKFLQESKRTIYFTEDNDVAKQTVISISMRHRTKIHALCLSNMIVFYQAGVPLKKGRATKKTNVENFKINRLTEEQIEAIERERMSKTGAVAKPSVKNMPVDMTWAIKIVKNFIAENDQVVTMVCNSSYARGFNLQKFKAVVHLDRDGWDSEEIKQRTARAFRQGQENEVLEVMVDAVAPNDEKGKPTVSIDELRGLVHETDQKFFNDIIKKSGAIKLSENYNAIEHGVVSDKMTTPNLEEFTRAILPTREASNEIDEYFKNKKEDPVKHTVLDPNRFNHPSIKTILQQLGTTVLTPELKEKLDVSGISGVLNVTPAEITSSVSVPDVKHIRLKGDWIASQLRAVNSDSVKNCEFFTTTCAPKSIGNKALFSQLVACKKAGKKELVTDGGGSFNSFDPETGLGKKGQGHNPMIGYYIWPKFGYDATVLILTLQYAPLQQNFDLVLKFLNPTNLVSPLPAGNDAQSQLVFQEELKNYIEKVEEHNASLKTKAVDVKVDKESVLDLISKLKNPDTKGLNDQQKHQIVTFLRDGAGWWHLKLAKCYYLVSEMTDVYKQQTYSLLDLYAITFTDSEGNVVKAGEELWKFFGSTTKLTLSLDDNSKSYKHLTKYVDAKVKEAGFETLEEYLSAPTDPFDTKSTECWFLFFRDQILTQLTKSEKATLVKTYMKDLKEVLVKANMNERVAILDSLKMFKENNPELSSMKLASKKYADEDQEVSSESLMGMLAVQDDALFTTITKELENEKTLENTQKEIAVLRGDLKPVLNPFDLSKKGNK